jgi:hypothetical protein
MNYGGLPTMKEFEDHAKKTLSERYSIDPEWDYPGE